MTSINNVDILKTNFDKLVKVAGVMLKAAEDSSASPQDVVNVINGVVDELLDVKSRLPGGEGQESQAPTQAPPGQMAEPANKNASLTKDTAEESREKVEEQNKSQLALHEKTFKAMQDRIDELESEKNQRVVEELATRYAETFPVGQRQAKYDQVLSSDEPHSNWEIRIEEREALTENSIQTARTQSTWLPVKTAKQTQRVRFI